MFDGKAIGEMLVPVVRDYVAKAIGGLADRLGAIEKRMSDMPIPLNGKDGSDGLAGKDGAPGRDGDRGPEGQKGMDGAAGPVGEQGPKGDQGERGEKGEAGPQGAQGEQGIAGKDGAAGIAGKDGSDGINGKDGADGVSGKDGADGINGKDGRDGIDGKDGAAGLNGKDGADGVAGKDGAPGINGKDGADGINGKDGADGIAGKDGAPGPEGQKGMDGRSVSIDEVRPIFEGEVAKWALDFERRASDALQKAIDRMPQAKDGKDGFSPDDFDLSLGEDNRTLNVTLRTADREITKSVTLPIPLDCGTYKVGMRAQKGDGITYGGSFWIAQRETTDTPGSSDAWRLAVKRGQDGKK